MPASLVCMRPNEGVFPECLKADAALLLAAFAAWRLCAKRNHAEAQNREGAKKIGADSIPDIASLLFAVPIASDKIGPYLIALTQKLTRPHNRPLNGIEPF